MSDELVKVQMIREAFEQEFERFADLSIDGLAMDDADQLLRALGELKIGHTGKKSEIAGAMKLIGKVAPEDRAAFGQRVQAVEKGIATRIGDLETKLTSFISNSKIERERLDVTIPGRRPRTGHLHPITILRQKIEDIFVSMGYAIEDDREIETDYYNFDALNIPEGHPARESQDTFYTTEGHALRSQTSTVQIRAMERRGVPLRILAPGKVFRRDTPDMTHTPMFHQLEGLCRAAVLDFPTVNLIVIKVLLDSRPRASVAGQRRPGGRSRTAPRGRPSPRLGRAKGASRRSRSRGG